MISAAPSDVAPGGRRSTRHQRSWYWYDWANSAYVTTTATVLFAPYLTAVAKAAACPDLADGAVCRTNLDVLGVPVSPGVAGPLHPDPLDHRLRARAGCRRRDRRPVRPAAPALRRLRLGRRGRGLGDVPRDRHQLAARRAAADRRQPVPRLRRWSSTTRCCAGSPGRTSATGCPAAAGRWATSAAACCSRSTWCWSPLHARVGLSEGAAVRVSLLSAGLWWAGFTVIPVLGLRDLPARQPTPADARAGVVRGSLAPAGRDVRRAARATRRRCCSCSPTCSTTTASRP